MYGWKENAMLTNCLAECAHLTITVSEIERDTGCKSSLFRTPLHLTSPLGGFSSEYRHPLWYGKTKMVSLPDGEKISKICLFVLTWSTNVTDGQTDGHCMTAKTGACIASRGNKIDKNITILNILFRTVENFLKKYWKSMEWWTGGLKKLY